MGELGPGAPGEAEAAIFTQQQERAEQLKDTTEDKAAKDLAELAKITENPMGLAEKPKGLDVVAENETSIKPETETALEGLVAQGKGLDDGDVKFILKTGNVPEQMHSVVLEMVKANLAAKEAKGPQA